MKIWNAGVSVITRSTFSGLYCSLSITSPSKWNYHYNSNTL